MSKITLGTHSGKGLTLSIDKLLRSRLLIQANSGGGKSWLLRRIAEQAFGKVQVIIIDPEGEFATLREKYDYVLVGKGGETPADVRSAKLVAHKLLELHACAVCDIFELPPFTRHQWVKEFLDAMIDSPKNLWHPVLVIVDEAHTYCPEKGAGESAAAESMISLATRGRKRGFCAVFATQRLGKLRKDAAAELTNVMIGKTWMDIDRKRAADALGVQHRDYHDFSEKMKALTPGMFLVQGVAVSTEMVEVKIGDVETSHPDITSRKAGSALPPPTPEAIRALLPRLAELPKQAEEKAKTEKELKAEIRSLKAQLAARPKEGTDPSAVDRAVRLAVDSALRTQSLEVKGLRQLVERMKGTFSQIAKDAMKAGGLEPPTASAAPTPVPVPRIERPPIRVKATTPESNGDLTGPEHRILNAIGWLNSIGIEEPEQTAVAFLAGYTVGGGGFNNPRGHLNQIGLVQYIAGNRIRLTEHGREVAEVPEHPLTTQELHRKVMEVLPGPEQKILQVLLESHPKALSNEECAQASGYTAGGGGYNNPRGRLRSLGLVEYPDRNTVRARDILFVD